jgi:hypothetical protein
MHVFTNDVCVSWSLSWSIVLAGAATAGLPCCGTSSGGCVRVWTVCAWGRPSGRATTTPGGASWPDTVSVRREIP